MKLSLCVRSSMPRVGAVEPLPPNDELVIDPALARVDASTRTTAPSSGWLHIRLPRPNAPRSAS